MDLFSTFRLWGLRPWPLLIWVSLLAGIALRPAAAYASHLRAGDIQAQIDANNPRRVHFRMVLYTDLIGIPNQPLATQPDVTIYFGDGTRQDGIRRTPDTVAQPIPGNSDTGLNVYLFEHTYPAASSYLVSFIGENRNSGVLNMFNSSAQTFYISTIITIDPTLGINHSPVLNAPAIDKAGTQQVFLHNPAASDADGDSLAFELRTSQQVIGGTTAANNNNNTPRPVDCTNFVYPNNLMASPGGVQVPYAGTSDSPASQPPPATAIFAQDSRTGMITWNAPSTAGYYNVAFIVREYRRIAGFRPRLIGEVIRDMQIIVRATNNLRPEITIPADICVVAGTTVTGNVTATDGTAPGSQAQTAIALFAYGGMLPTATITPVGNFVQTQVGPPQATGRFTWRTECANVAKDPYIVVFKAQDTPNIPSEPSLIDEKTWRITVVGPPPQRLAAVPSLNGGKPQMQLTWDSYTCQNAARIYIYRKENPGIAPGPCVTGIPASAGYTRIASVTAATRSYIDDDGGQGLKRGTNYCYRIYAEFPLPARGESLASDEACALIVGRSAQLTNVDVDRTSPTTGQITVRWTRPRNADGSANFAGPAGYRLLRGPGLNPTAFTLARTFTSLADTVLVDTNLDTETQQYTYKLEFFYALGGISTTEVAPLASSVRTSALPNPAATAFVINWTHQVPWDNSAQPAIIFRRTGTGAFARIGTAATSATGGTYTDRDPTLSKGTTYCYYVLTTGQYPGISYLNSLLNKSQELCAQLVSPPCTPVLTLLNTNCDSLAALPEFPQRGQHYTNRLRWTLGNSPAGCDATISSYRLYYRPGPEGNFTLLTTTTSTSFEHRNLAAPGGCYYVEAEAPSGVSSAASNLSCQDNCVFFVLPNIFSPNGDGRNDTFRPKNSSPLHRIHFTAYNRWGVKIFENTTISETFIDWDGSGPAGERLTTAKAPDGVYYYVAEVEFADFASTRRTYKGWVEIIK